MMRCRASIQRLCRKRIVAAAVCIVAQSMPVIAVASQPALDHVDFERHVVSLFGRLGCNGAACHGSFQGKGGFRLSLFGQSSEMDFDALVGTAESSRVDIDSPDDSLLLLKPSGREPHGGGVRLPEGSWEYRLIRRWIAAGARRTPDSGVVTRLAVEPADLPPLRPDDVIPLRVLAHFANNTQEDVTAFSEFRSRDEHVVECAANGSITARNSGDTSIVVSYRGTFVGVPVVVPYPARDDQIVAAAATNLIDDEINAKLARLSLSASPRADDAEFLRRATLDVLGTLPAPDDVRRFIADAEPEKRAKAIDRLLAHPRRAALWATKMCDITACNVEILGSPDELRPKWAKMWHDWFRRRFAGNMPYDQMAHGVLCATSREEAAVATWIDAEVAQNHRAQSSFDTNYAERASLDLFWRRIGPQGLAPVEDLAELTASAFLGLRLHCARCHQHPYDRWTQRDFAGFANIFARVEYGSSTELRTQMNERLEQRRRMRQTQTSLPFDLAMTGEPTPPAPPCKEGESARDHSARGRLPELPRVQEVFLRTTPRPLVDAGTPAPAPPQAPGGPVLSDEEDPREALFRWLCAPENPYFSKSFVNRVWAKYFGTGLVEPVDAFAASNPATHPRLLERLADEFVQSGYDIVRLERAILSSETYQRSAAPFGNNAFDRHNLARAPTRPLMAETLLDALNAALETTDDFGKDAPAGSQAIELAPNRFSDAGVNEMFRILGRPDRKSLCDCDRNTTPSLRLPLFLMSDPRVVDKLARGRLARLVAEEKSDAEIVEELYLATLSRLPGERERAFCRQLVAGSADRQQALGDLVWGLINTREFMTNH